MAAFRALPFFRTAPLANQENSENPWAASKSSKPQQTFRSQSWEQQRGKNGGGLPPFSRFPTPAKDPGSLFVLSALIILALWLASGLYRVLPEENAVLLRFGKYAETMSEPGLHYHWPRPIEMVLKPNVTFERRLELGYRGSSLQNGNRQDIPEESMMLTGDANIVDLDFVVQWKIDQAKEFLFNIRDPELTLKRVAESAMREVVGQNELQDIITDRREEIAARVKLIMQETLTSYKAGIVVTQVLIQNASVPPPVIGAFEDVIKANQQAETLRNQALRYRNEIVPVAQGDAIRLIKEAEAYQESVVADAKGNAERFLDIYNGYAAAKEVTRERLYIDAWQDILQNTNAIIVDGSKTGALPYLNLGDLRRKTDNETQETLK